MDYIIINNAFQRLRAVFCLPNGWTILSPLRDTTAEVEEDVRPLEQMFSPKIKHNNND